MRLRLQSWINSEERAIFLPPKNTLTLNYSNLGLLKIGDKVNIECSMLMKVRLGGHLIHGHMDETVICIGKKDANGSTEFTFKYPENIDLARKGYLAADKGGVTVNGTSLTVCNPSNNTFLMTIIPYILTHTNSHNIETGKTINMKFDAVGKYIARLSDFNNHLIENIVSIN